MGLELVTFPKVERGQIVGTQFHGRCRRCGWTSPMVSAAGMVHGMSCDRCEAVAA